MPYYGFHSEWVTIENTRVFLQCRGGFPTEKMHFIARIAIEALRKVSDDARLVKIYYDDKASCHLLTFASDNPDDHGKEDGVVCVVNDYYEYANDIAEMIIVGKGDKSHDHYVHMEHLSCEAGVAVDRWKLYNKEYMKGVEFPS